eukprot:gene5711-6603_t
MSIEAASHLFKKIGNHDPKIISKAILNGKRHPLIRLDKNGLGDEGLIPISRALKQQAIVESLDLSDNNITIKGIRDLAVAINSNKSLLHLKLDNNPIGDEGLGVLCQVFKNNGNNIKSIYMSDCQITERGIALLANSLETNTTIVTIHINSNKIGNEGATYLSKSLTSNTTLRNLSCFVCGIGDEGALKLLTYLETTKISISNINLKGNKISKTNMEKINQLITHKKIKEKRRKLKAEAQELINEETDRMVKIKMKDVNDYAQKQLEEKMKDLGKKEDALNSKQTELNSKLKEFEKKRIDTSSAEKEKEKSKIKEKKKKSSSTKKKKSDDSITVVVAGDKDQDKESLFSYGTTVIENCKVVSDSEFEKTINGDIFIEGKQVNFTLVNTSSHDRYSRLRALQYEHASAAIILYTTNDRISFDDITFQWLPEINFMSKIPIFITGMQSDKRSNPPKSSEVTEIEAKELCKNIGSGSNTYSEPVCAEDFRKMVTMIYKEIKKKKK